MRSQPGITNDSLETPKPRALAERLKLRSYCLTLSADADQPEQRRRWFQFRLWTWVLLVTIVSLPSGWLAWRMEYRCEEPPVEAAIFIHGGVFARRQLVPAPTIWRQELLDDDLDDSISGITFVGVTATDTELHHIAAMDSLEYLSLRNAAVTDAGLAELKRLTRLKLLDLSGTKITNAGLAELTPLAKLKYLNLTETSATDAGISKLQKTLPDCNIDR
jgi:hypothetical protein